MVTKEVKQTDIEEMTYEVKFAFSTPDDKLGELTINSAPEEYTIEIDGIVKYQVSVEKMANERLISELDDHFRDVFVSLYQTTNKLMKSELLKKMEI